MEMNANTFIGLSIVKYHLKKLEIVENSEKIIYMYCLYYLCLTHTEKYLFYCTYVLTSLGTEICYVFVMFYSIKKS